MVPRMEVVERLTERKSFAKVGPNYIRLPRSLNLPKPDEYELS